jgi:hypothetical protein
VLKLLRQALFVGVLYALILALWLPGAAATLTEHGRWWTAAYYGALTGVACLVLGIIDAWLSSKAAKVTKAVEGETPEERLERIKHVAEVAGSDRLPSDEYGLLMAHVAELGEASKEAQREHRRAVMAYARHSSEVGPILYAPGPEPLVKPSRPAHLAEVG